MFVFHVLSKEGDLKDTTFDQASVQPIVDFIDQPMKKVVQVMGVLKVLL